MKTLHRYRFVLLAAAAVGLVAATIVTMRSNDTADRIAGHLGPTPGPPTSDAYVAAKRSYVADLAKQQPTRRAGALVSLNKYVAASSAQTLARGMSVSGVFVKFPSADAELVVVRTTLAGAVADRASAMRREVDAEIKALNEQLTTVQGAERQEIERVLAERRGALAKLGANCACVYAFAVQRVELTALGALSARPEVKLVDVPRPVVADLAGWELGPIVPKG